MHTFSLFGWEISVGPGQFPDVEAPSVCVPVSNGEQAGPFGKESVVRESLYHSLLKLALSRIGTDSPSLLCLGPLEICIGPSSRFLSIYRLQLEGVLPWQRRPALL